MNKRNENAGNHNERSREMPRADADVQRRAGERVDRLTQNDPQELQKELWKWREKTNQKGTFEHMRDPTTGTQYCVYGDGTFAMKENGADARFLSWEEINQVPPQFPPFFVSRINHMQAILQADYDRRQVQAAQQPETAQQMQAPEQRAQPQAPERQEQPRPPESPAAKVREQLRSIVIQGPNGNILKVEGVPESDDDMRSLLRRESIPVGRYDYYIRNLQESASHMQRALLAIGQWNGTVSLDKNRLISQDRLTNDCIVATPLFALFQKSTDRTAPLWLPQRDQYGNFQQGNTRQITAEKFRLIAHGDTRDGAIVYQNKYDEHADRFAAYYVFNKGEGNRGGSVNHSNFFGADGGLQYRVNGPLASPQNVQYFDGTSNDRPSVIKTLRNNDKVEYGSEQRDRPGIRTIERHDLDGLGVYVVPEKRGPPIGSLEQVRENIRSQKGLQGNALYEEMATFLAGSLKTPEAIGAYLTAHIGRINRNPALFNNSHRGGMRYQAESNGQDEAQDAYTTFERTTGDCEDYALAGQYLLKKLGIRSAVIRVSSNHTVCAFFEEKVDGNGDRRYDVCILDTGGFHRSSGSEKKGISIFRSLEQAASILCFEGRNDQLKVLHALPGEEHYWEGILLSEKEKLEKVRSISEGGGRQSTSQKAREDIQERRQDSQSGATLPMPREVREEQGGQSRETLQQQYQFLTNKQLVRHGSPSGPVDVQYSHGYEVHVPRDQSVRVVFQQNDVTSPPGNEPVVGPQDYHGTQVFHSPYLIFREGQGDKQKIRIHGARYNPIQQIWVGRQQVF